MQCIRVLHMRNNIYICAMVVKLPVASAHIYKWVWQSRSPYQVNILHQQILNIKWLIDYLVNQTHQQLPITRYNEKTTTDPIRSDPMTLSKLDQKYERRWKKTEIFRDVFSCVFFLILNQIQIERNILWFVWSFWMHTSLLLNKFSFHFLFSYVFVATFISNRFRMFFCIYIFMLHIYSIPT